MRFFEDFAVGDRFEFGTYEVTESEILSFAERYDPQWYHTDPERARAESLFGAHSASGWHTTAMTMRLLVDGLFGESATLGAKGVDELRWWKPVVPGDALSVDVEVTETTAESDDRGLVRLRVRTFADRAAGDREKVCSFVALVLFGRRGGE